MFVERDIASGRTMKKMRIGDIIPELTTIVPFAKRNAPKIQTAQE